MSITTEIDAALGEMETALGETITIYGSTPGSTYIGLATVTGGAAPVDYVTGGSYEGNAYSISVRISSLAGFVPVPEMLVDARGKELRIAPDGVTAGRAHYHIMVIGRDVPR